MAAPGADPEKLRALLQQAMTAGAGVLRSSSSLAQASATLDAVAAQLPDGGEGAAPGWAPLANLVEVGRALVAAALAREESRGNHTRVEFPSPRDQFLVRLVVP
jgi:L-aspartate oxidase